MGRGSNQFAWDLPGVNTETFMSLEPLSPRQASTVATLEKRGPAGRAPMSLTPKAAEASWTGSEASGLILLCVNHGDSLRSRGSLWLWGRQPRRMGLLPSGAPSPTRATGHRARNGLTSPVGTGEGWRGERSAPCLRLGSWQEEAGKTHREDGVGAGCWEQTNKLSPPAGQLGDCSALPPATAAEFFPSSPSFPGEPGGQWPAEVPEAGGVGAERQSDQGGRRRQSAPDSQGKGGQAELRSVSPRCPAACPPPPRYVASHGGCG